MSEELTKKEIEEFERIDEMITNAKQLATIKSYSDGRAVFSSNLDNIREHIKANGVEGLYNKLALLQKQVYEINKEVILESKKESGESKTIKEGDLASIIKEEFEKSKKYKQHKKDASKDKDEE